MMRLSGPGGREQIDICLAKLRDQAKTGHLASLVTFNETPALEAFLAKPRIAMNAWHENDHCHVANADATEPLALFLAQVHEFEPVCYGHMQTPCTTEADFRATIDGLTRLTQMWGFTLIPGKPEWINDLQQVPL